VLFPQGERKEQTLQSKPESQPTESKEKLDISTNARNASKSFPV